MSDLNRFGPIIDSGRTAELLMARLQEWLPTYLYVMDQSDPLPDSITTSQVKSWEITPSLDLSDEPQMPAVKIVSPGPSEPPVSDGRGVVRAAYENNVVVIVAGPTESDTRKLRDRFEAAVVACVMEKRSLGDPNVRGTDYNGAWKFDLPADERRTKQAVSCGFSIEYENVVTWKAGPETPIIPDDPSNGGAPGDPGDPNNFPDLGVVRDPDSIPPYNPIRISQLEDES